MIKYIVNENISLSVLGREKEFSKGEEIYENVYTNTYPRYFKRIGTESGYNIHLETKKVVVDKVSIKKVPKASKKQIEVKEIEDIIDNYDVKIETNQED